MRRFRIGIGCLGLTMLLVLGGCTGQKPVADKSKDKQPEHKTSVGNSTNGQTAAKSNEAKTSKDAAGTDKTAAKSTKKSDSETKAVTVKAELASWKQLEAFVKTQQGKVVIVDLWAMW